MPACPPRADLPPSRGPRRRLAAASRRPVALVLAFVFASGCQSVPEPPAPGAAAPVPGAVEASGDALEFPPAPSRRDRRALPKTLRTSGTDGEIGIVSPELDDDGKFEFAGQTLRISFNAELDFDPTAATPPLQIAPPVAGRLQKKSGSAIEFVADAPFDPDATYTARLVGLTDGAGRPVLAGWTAKFRADPQVWIGGKMLPYLPKPGAPRIVTMTPPAGVELGARPSFDVLFDQPIEPAAAAALVELRRAIPGGDRAVPMKARRGAKNVFEGLEIDRRHVVTLTSGERLPAGTKLTLERKDPDVSEYDASSEFAVAGPMEHRGVECWSTDCTFAASVLRMSGGGFAVTYANTIAVKAAAAKSLVTITPAVPNLSVYNDGWSSSGRINVSGGFAPSSKYDVTVAAVRDRFGQGAAPVHFTIETPPLPASVSMAEGSQALTAPGARAIEVHTRNVTKAKLLVWTVGDDAAAWDAAHTQLGNREPPGGAPDHTVVFEPAAVLDTDVVTTVDLTGALALGRPHLVALILDEPAFGAARASYPSWSSAARPPMAMLTVFDDTALAVHTQSMPDAVLVHVARVTTGEPVAGARFRAEGHDLAAVTTDADGVAILPVGREAADAVLLHVEHDAAHAQLRLGKDGHDASGLAPHIAGEVVPAADTRAMIITDRGVYRPGSKIFFKGIARRREGDALPPLAHFPVRMRVTSPTGDLAFTTTGWSNAHGSFSGEFVAGAHAEIGRYTLEFAPIVGDDGPWAQTTVQIAEFEPPRFTVDVDATGDAAHVVANVTGRYLFGATMDGAHVMWSLSRRPATLPPGDMVGRGLAFTAAGAANDWNEDSGEGPIEGDGTGAWSRSGEAELGDGGMLAVDQAVEMPTAPGPQRFAFEATVQDESHRTIAARDEVTVFDAPRYAGVRVTDRSIDLRPGATNTVPLELGVADHEGNAVAGRTIEAVLERVDWQRTRKPRGGGGYDVQWHEVRTVVARCSATSTHTVVDCPLAIERSGDYAVTASVDGRTGGTAEFWAWEYGDSTRPQRPGNTLEVVADRRVYAPGDTATIEIVSPFAAAIAIVTLEGGGARITRSARVQGASARFELPLGSEHAPWAHVTATLLPIDAEPAAALQWKFGALRLPVALDDARVELAVKSDREVYAPGERARIDLDVTQGGAGVAGAEIVLAVVDEGILRLTDFHAPDPVTALRAGGGLSVYVNDNRDLFASLGLRAHVAGDGGSEGDASLVSTRKNFVQTALWRPDLVTDEAGHATLQLPLPDNLTRFRMMAVVLDPRGRGAVSEAAFEVKKPLMVVPAVPRFAVVGDRFEAAAVVHNGTDTAMTATVSMGESSRQVELPAGGRSRVAFDFAAAAAGPQTLVFDAVATSGERDRVEAPLPIQAPGIDERPRLAGTFTGAQDVRLTIPDDIFTDDDAGDLIVTMGAALWPELGERIEFLVDYPHGCVEQTTSSTLPLLAARDLLPRLGFLRFSQAQLDDRIAAGIERLASMRTPEGGLAYWPGQYDANPYGTAYAMRAVVRAEAAGVAIPAGLREGMTTYLQEQLTGNSSMYPGDLEVRAAIALALAEAGALPASATDALFDTAPNQGPFGKATLALALALQPGEATRVQSLIDGMLTAFDATGTLVTKPTPGEFAYYGSPERTRAQAALALLRLRPTAPMLPAMLDALVTQTDRYTTQSTAFGLIALAEHLNTVTAEPVELALVLDGEVLTAGAIESVQLGAGALRYRIPLSRLRGRDARLQLRAGGERAIGFMVEATWRRPFASTGTLAATSAEGGPDLYRVFNDPTGGAIDLAKVAPGQVVRVTLLARMPGGDFDRDRLGYVAITDAIGAGFEPVQPDLATMTTVPDLPHDHPLAQMLSWGSAEPSHSELRDDRVNLYFDRVWGDWVVGTYLVRATTPGSFVVAPARVELMYEPGSVGYSDMAAVTVVP